MANQKYNPKSFMIGGKRGDDTAIILPNNHLIWKLFTKLVEIIFTIDYSQKNALNGLLSTSTEHRTSVIQHEILQITFDMFTIFFVTCLTCIFLKEKANVKNVFIHLKCILLSQYNQNVIFLNEESLS